MTARRSGSSSAAPSRAGDGATVLLDTNVLLLRWGSAEALREAVDAHVPGARLVVPALVEVELDRLERRRPGATAGARALAGAFARVASGVEGDSDLLALATARRAWVATTDRDLRARLLRAGVRVLYPRRGGRLVPFEGPPGRQRTTAGQRL